MNIDNSNNIVQRNVFIFFVDNISIRFVSYNIKQKFDENNSIDF